jgi:hypothetical protein
MGAGRAGRMEERKGKREGTTPGRIDKRGEESRGGREGKRTITRILGPFREHQRA